MRSGEIRREKDLLKDDSAWADFLISKGALILASVIFFAAFFQLIAGFKDLEAQEQLEFLARDFKVVVDEAGAESFEREASEEFSYRFDENEIFRASPFGKNIEVLVSGEYVHLKAKYDEKSFSAVRPFAFRVLPFNESVLRESLHTEFGAEGCEDSPLTAELQEIKAFLQVSGAREVVLNAGENVSIKKELIYLKDSEGVSAFGCVLVYQ
ncbi:TPA: hypothetical protein HA338_07665 [Methanosarcina acetivorans]|uniref:Uncharacterized protein n=2 Tax=Methanosarcina acetivorans TaxID=2214 RepID=Q8TS59_METAC|nr:hypothetical protein [Methanosarcina acetivorans]AAM04379.1 predicted protein [Methanosarcina acetivorans C2A]HIH93912.1 hypothetical protein [Methanosarcina acetivorans]